MITLKEVAAAANVSTVTASSVLSGVNRVRVSPSTAERIHRIAKSLNYVPLAAARGLRTGKTRIIAFVSSSHSKFRSDDTWHESLRGVSDLMWEREERLMLVMSRSREHELEIIRQMAYGRQVDGFIIQNPGAADDDHIAMLLHSERPFVIMGGAPRTDVNSVSFDMAALAADIAGDLRANGCGAVLLLPPLNLGAGVYAPFFDFFARWERDTGIRVLRWQGAFVPDSLRLADIRQSLNGGRLGVALLRSLLPETVNALAGAGLAAGERSHIVYASTGEDILLDPSGLSVMHFDNYTLGRRAARLLMSIVDNPKDAPAPLPVSISIPPAQRG